MGHHNTKNAFVFIISMISVGAWSNDSVAQDSSYKNYKQRYQQQYKDFKTAYQKRYEAFKAKITGEWGDQTELSDADTFVQYSAHMQQRTVIDFAKQSIAIERLDGEPIDAETVASVLQQLNTLSIADQARLDPILKANGLSNSNSLLNAWAPGLSISDILAKSDIKASESVATIDIAFNEASFGFGFSALAAMTPWLQEAEKNAAKRKRVRRMMLNLNQPDLMQQRAQPYQAQAQQLAEQLQLPYALVMAIMEVESGFNPLAQSPIPAFGLMQIIPTTVGLEVNKEILKRDGIPTTETLLNASENMNYGSNYLALLRQRYLSGIRDSQSQLFCMIASYTAGANNVAKAFHQDGPPNLQAALEKINSLSADEVLATLEQKLSRQENRQYLQRINKAMSSYKS